MARFCPSCAFILDLGGMGVCCSVLFCPRLQACREPPGVLRWVSPSVFSPRRLPVPNPNLILRQCFGYPQVRVSIRTIPRSLVIWVSPVTLQNCLFVCFFPALCAEKLSPEGPPWLFPFEQVSPRYLIHRGHQKVSLCDSFFCKHYFTGKFTEYYRSFCIPVNAPSFEYE